MKVVYFKDDTYGIRRYNWTKLSYEYKVLKVGDNTWLPQSSPFFYDCKVKSLDNTKSYFYNIVDKGTPIKDKL